MDVLIVGGGYAGISVAHKLERACSSDVELAIIDSDGTHVLRHLLHRLIRSPGVADRIRIPIAEVLARTTVIEERVTQIDPDAARVETASGRTLEPQYLVVCPGASVATHGIPGVREHGLPVGTVDDVLQIRERLAESDVAHIIVVGAGLTGIQLAGELAAWRDASNRTFEITLLEQAQRIAPEFPSRFREGVIAALQAQAVRIRTTTTVDEISDSATHLADGESLPSDVVVWTAGIAGHPALGGTRPQVRADLKLADRTFALGDAVSIVDQRGERIPASAQTAVRQATVVARSLLRLLNADSSFVFRPRPARYVYDSQGWIVSVGDDAVASLGDYVVRGPPATALKVGVEAGYLGSIGRIDEAIDVIAESVG